MLNSLSPSNPSYSADWSPLVPNSQPDTEVPKDFIYSLMNDPFEKPKCKLDENRGTGMYYTRCGNIRSRLYLK